MSPSRLARQQAMLPPCPPRKPNLNGATLLLAEDQPSMRKALSYVLESWNATVLAAADGTEALALYHQNTDSIVGIITDTNMPEMDGDKLLAAIIAERQQQGAPPLPLMVLMSGDANNQSLAVSLPKVCFLSKPFHNPELLKLLEAAQILHWS